MSFSPGGWMVTAALSTWRLAAQSCCRTPDGPAPSLRPRECWRSVTSRTAPRAVRAIEEDYEKHSRAAQALASTVFSPLEVLKPLLEKNSLSSPRVKF